MAIKRNKETVESVSLPAKLASFCKKAFTSDAMAKFFEGMSKEAKGELKDYLENNDDGFELDLSQSKGFVCEEGRVTFATRSRYEYDADKIIDLVKSGAIPLETLVNCISTFKDKDLKTALGSKFDEVATQGFTEFLQLKANDAFKSKIASIVGEQPIPEKEHVEKAEKAKEEIKSVKAKPTKKVAKEKVAKEKVELTLDDILNGR